MFKKQNLNIPLHKGSFLPIGKVVEILGRAYQMQQSGFEWVMVDKPIGTIY
jgi:hypothetical protein